MKIPDYYKILGLPKSASKNEIKKAYRKLALEFHPDHNRNPDAHEKFISINEAYLILFDEEARVKYDAEYDVYFKKEKFKTKSENEYSEENNEKKRAYNNEKRFDDSDLDDWSKKAKQQGAEYARMTFDEFSKMLLGIVKETGFQLGNVLLIILGSLITMGGCSNIILGISSNGVIRNTVLGLIMLPIGYLFFKAADKNWNK
jgi:curved DNA-binding protein CbpA